MTDQKHYLNSAVIGALYLTIALSVGFLTNYGLDIALPGIQDRLSVSNSERLWAGVRRVVGEYVQTPGGIVSGLAGLGLFRRLGL